MADVFISYSKRDASYVSWLGAALTEFGVRVDLEAGRRAAEGVWGE